MALAESFPVPTEATRQAALYPVIAETYESTTSGMLVKPEIMQQLAELRSQGVDADIMDVKTTHSLTLEVQDQVDRQSAAIGQLPKKEAHDTLFDPSVHSAGAEWAKLSKRAIALWALKQSGEPTPHMIAPGIDPAIYDEPLFGGRSAHDVMHATHPRSADLVAERYRTITSTLLEDKPYHGHAEDSLYLQFLDRQGLPFLSSRDFLTGVLDSRAVDTRATAATQLALEHVLANPEQFSDRPLVTASLACGAAASMFELNQAFAQKGIEIGKNILVDNDPMALASAVALGRAYGMSDKVDAQLRDIVSGDLTEYIEPHSVDVVDILGIVDYLPTSIKGYKAAANFIGKIANIVRPGGIIVAGNALLHRPHQAFFEKVWPKLQQRDLPEMVDIITDAGYNRQTLQVRVPQNEGVYGIYGIKVPAAESPRYFTEARTQRAARKILTVVSKFNKY